MNKNQPDDRSQQMEDDVDRMLNQNKQGYQQYSQIDREQINKESISKSQIEHAISSNPKQSNITPTFQSNSNANIAHIDPQNEHKNTTSQQIDRSKQISFDGKNDLVNPIKNPDSIKTSNMDMKQNKDLEPSKLKNEAEQNHNQSVEPTNCKLCENCVCF